MLASMKLAQSPMYLWEVAVLLLTAVGFSVWVLAHMLPAVSEEHGSLNKIGVTVGPPPWKRRQPHPEPR